MKHTRRNDREREQWVLNDEGLYNWQRSSRQSMRAFIRENRAEIDRAIDAALDRKPAEKTWRDYAGNYGLGYMQGKGAA